MTSTTTSTTTYGSGTGPRAQQALRDQQEREHFADDLGRWAADEAESAHDAHYTEHDLSHGRLCCIFSRDQADRDEYAFALELPIEALRRRWQSGLEERAVARAQREGVL